MALNYWLIKFKQVLLAIVLTALLIEMLRYFRDFSWLRIRFGQKFFYCVVMDRVIEVVLFLLKLTICYDSTDRFKEGSLGAHTNKVMLDVWSATKIAVWSVLFILPFETQFVYQLVLIVWIVVILLWRSNYRELQDWRKKDKERHIKRLLPGLNEALNGQEIRALSNLGIKSTNKFIGFGCYGTTYRCGNFVLKVIDVKEWCRNRAPGDRPEVIDHLAHVARHRYRQMVVRLRGLSNKNCVKWQRIHHEEVVDGAFRRIYLVTKWATMNLDSFLSDHRPNGVPEGWAREWFGQVCNGLLYLHKVFVIDELAHADIKPENILLFERPRPRFQFGQQSSYDSVNRDLKDRYHLKLSDCGLDSFLPLNGKVVTKRNPILMISPPKKVVGKRNLRILSVKPRNHEKKCDDIYQMGVILMLLLRGDIRQLIKEPEDTERIHNFVTGVDAIYVRFDKLEFIKRLITPIDPSEHLIPLLRKMLEWEPLQRYDIRSVINSDWMRGHQ